MRDSKNSGQKTTQRSHDNGCCNFVIKSKKLKTINIDCSPPSTTSEPPKEEQEECPPRAPGACIPLALGSKPKQSLSAKLGKLLANNPIPSVLAATILQQARRFLLGRSPGNALEASVFEVFNSLSPELKNTLACTLETFDDLPKDERDSLFQPDLLVSVDQALDPAQIADLLVDEIRARTANEVFADKTCTDERPGLARPIMGNLDGEIFFAFPSQICRVNNLRTIHFEPPLAPGDYEPDELQQICTPEVTNGEVRFNCRVQSGDCPGHQLSDGTCLRVPEVASGDTVVLEGVNFFNVEAKVRLRAKPPGTASREVEAFVCGDRETPATEKKNGIDVPIIDCRVHDRLAFQIPDELPIGIYEVRVAIPNNTGLPGTDIEISSEIFINVVPPATAIFQIASEGLHAQDETSPAFFGSDEVAIRFIAVPIFTNTTELEMNNPINFRFDDVDSGDNRDMNRVLIQESGLAGVSIAIVGFEVDSEDAFEKQIDSFTDAFVEIMKRIWNAIKDVVGRGVSEIEKFGSKGAIAAAIGAAVVFVIVVIVALWAPADLIIEDTIALSVTDLAELTSTNFPLPAEVEFKTNGGIDVKIVPIIKSPQQYRERREYRSEDEGSEYHITLRYNRLA